jgi:hypothetical protein
LRCTSVQIISSCLASLNVPRYSLPLWNSALALGLLRQCLPIHNSIRYECYNAFPAVLKFLAIFFLNIYQCASFLISTRTQPRCEVFSAFLYKSCQHRKSQMRHFTVCLLFFRGQSLQPYSYSVMSLKANAQPWNLSLNKPLHGPPP